MDAKKSQHPATRSGFTLVELLVVIVIISMLAGLAITGGGAAMRAAKRATICSEISMLTMALEQYKNECGEYPPDCFSTDLANDTATQNAILRHFRKRFPRYQPGKYSESLVSFSNLGSNPNWSKLRLDAYNATRTRGSDLGNPASIGAAVDHADETVAIDLDRLTPASAITFLLAGLPDADGKPDGFSANPNNPFAKGGSRTTPFFEFDELRYGVVKGEPLYVPKHIKNPANSNEGLPYVYFRSRSGDYGPRTLGDIRDYNYQIPRYPLTPNTDYGICLPYARTEITSNILSDDTKYPDTNEINWYADKRFQIIAAGLDGEYGTTDSSFDPDTSTLNPYRYFNDNGSNLTPAEDDNLSNITPGKLEDGVQ